MILAAAMALASSHRDAPSLALDPAADVADVYAFLDPTDTSRLVLAATVFPHAAASGPLFARFDDAALYELRVDHDGDAVEDVRFQFRFSTAYPSSDALTFNDGTLDDPESLAVVQTYTVTRVDASGATEIAAGTVAPPNVGGLGATAGLYMPSADTLGSLATAHVVSAGDVQAFAGPRQDGSFADLGHLFDGLDLAGAEAEPRNTRLGENVLAFAIRVPVTALTRDGAAPNREAKNDVVAAWATTSRRAITVRRADGASNAARGEWVQVDRAGNPWWSLLFLPLIERDRFAGSRAIDDLGMVTYAKSPLLPARITASTGATCATEADLGLGVGGREDLVALLMVGVAAAGNVPADWSLGGAIAGGDGKTFSAFEALRVNLAGTGTGHFPDGRRPEDDVLDAVLSAACGYYVDGTTVTDGIDGAGLARPTSFPFLGDPWSATDVPR
jgi:hypothetical protein